MASIGDFEGLPDVIKKLTESPEIAEIIKNAGLSKAEESSSAKVESKPEGFSLSPEMMAKLPSVISMLQGMGIGSAEGKTEAASPAVDMNEMVSRLPQAMSALSSIGVGSNQNHKGKGEDKKREALLKALRPYMCERKRGAIDAMLGIGSLAEIIMMLTGGES